MRPSLKGHGHVKTAPEALWNTGFAVVCGKHQAADELCFAMMFRFVCGCIDQTNPRGEHVQVLTDIMFAGAPAAEFSIITIQPLDPT